MQIKSLHIKNFKSIRELKITDIENSLILVGKNNTGKTVVLDAIRAVTGHYDVEEADFNEKKQNIEIANGIIIAYYTNPKKMERTIKELKENELFSSNVICVSNTPDMERLEKVEVELKKCAK